MTIKIELKGKLQQEEQTSFLKYIPIIYIEKVIMITGHLRESNFKFSHLL